MLWPFVWRFIQFYESMQKIVLLLYSVHSIEWVWILYTINRTPTHLHDSTNSAHIPIHAHALAHPTNTPTPHHNCTKPKISQNIDIVHKVWGCVRERQSVYDVAVLDSKILLYIIYTIYLITRFVFVFLFFRVYFCIL